MLIDLLLEFLSHFDPYLITVVRTHLWLWTIYLRGNFKFGMGLVLFIIYVYR